MVPLLFTPALGPPRSGHLDDPGFQTVGKEGPEDGAQRRPSLWPAELAVRTHLAAALGALGDLPGALGAQHRVARVPRRDGDERRPDPSGTVVGAGRHVGLAAFLCRCG